MAPAGLAESFSGAFQASLSILIVIFTGVIAAQFKLLDASSAKSISKVCVKLFMPALLITKIGSQLHIETASQYVPILVWALFYILVSIAIGELAARCTRLPNWVVPALAFNNTTSLPLLLIQSLSATGILKRIIVKDESQEEVIERAKTYFLVCAIVGNCLTFALGPRLLDTTQEHIPDEQESKDTRGLGGEEDEEGDEDEEADEEAERDEHDEAMWRERIRQQSVDEMTSLLPSFVYNAELRTSRRAYSIGRKRWDTFSPRLQSFLLFLYDFVNAPFIGAVIGVIIGLTPPLHRAFFNSSFEGGFLNAWLTTALSSIGNLFVSLQVVVVGVTLSSSLRKMKRGESSGDVPVLATLFVLIIRFVIWPLVSIGLIHLLAKKTNVLGNDTVLWFAMMLMPTGPPAIKLVAMADVNGASEAEKMSISKLLVIAYAISPILAFTVVGALHASESIIKT